MAKLKKIEEEFLFFPQSFTSRDSTVLKYFKLNEIGPCKPPNLVNGNPLASARPSLVKEDEVKLEADGCSRSIYFFTIKNERKELNVKNMMMIEQDSFTSLYGKKLENKSTGPAMLIEHYQQGQKTASFQRLSEELYLDNGLSLRSPNTLLEYFNIL